jgi:hypothetical protein
MGGALGEGRFATAATSSSCDLVILPAPCRPAEDDDGDGHLPIALRDESPCSLHGAFDRSAPHAVRRVDEQDRAARRTGRLESKIGDGSPFSVTDTLSAVSARGSGRR